MTAADKPEAPDPENARLRAMLAHAEEVNEREKLQLARTLHNEFGSALTALAMRMALLARLPADAPGAAEQWAKANAILAGLTQTARQVQSDLRSGALDVVGLKMALEEYLVDFGERHAIGVALALPDDELALEPARAVALFRIFQELLRNVRLHASASQVHAALMLDPQAAALNLSVADNGVGFDAATYDLKRSHGLRRIAERAAFLGGGMQIDSAAGQGTRVLITLALSNPPLNNAPLP
jgi:two-component system sensor histidine kinase UhpB